MQIEAGRFYRTRDGQQVVIRARAGQIAPGTGAGTPAATRADCFEGYLVTGHKAAVWTGRGMHEQDWRLDLVAPWPEPEGDSFMTMESGAGPEGHSPEERGKAEHSPEGNRPERNSKGREQSCGACVDQKSADWKGAGAEKPQGQASADSDRKGDGGRDAASRHGFPPRGELASRACGQESPVRDDTPPHAFQIGGDHYKGHAIQPIEFILANDLGFCEGNIVKYATRYKVKGGIEDLRKLRHYADFLIREYEKHVAD